MSLRVKICGIRDAATATAVVAAGADYVGVVFFPASPRHVSHDQAAAIARVLPEHVPLVAVTVDASDVELEAILTQAKANMLQLHGSETPARVAEIKQRFNVPVIKAVKVSSGDDIAAARAFEAVADMLLFDAKPPKFPGVLPGGNGLSFDWELLKGREFGLPWFLSGGLNAQNLAKAVAESGAAMLDVSSSVESAPGVKDMALITAFLSAAGK